MGGRIPKEMAFPKIVFFKRQNRLNKIIQAVGIMFRVKYCYGKTHSHIQMLIIAPKLYRVSILT